MKKYNTPEMKVAIFNSESVLTASAAVAQWDETYNAATYKKTITWNDILSETEITF